MKTYEDYKTLTFVFSKIQIKFENRNFLLADRKKYSRLTSSNEYHCWVLQDGLPCHVLKELIHKQTWQENNNKEK